MFVGKGFPILFFKKSLQCKCGFVVFEPRSFRVFQGEVHVVQHLVLSPVVKRNDLIEVIYAYVEILLYPAAERPQGWGQHRQVQVAGIVVDWEASSAAVVLLGRSAKKTYSGRKSPSLRLPRAS